MKESFEMETTIMGFIGTTVRIHSFIPSYPKVSNVYGLSQGLPGGCTIVVDITILGLKGKYDHRHIMHVRSNHKPPN